jgi:hypothetical protein
LSCSTWRASDFCRCLYTITCTGLSAVEFVLVCGKYVSISVWIFCKYWIYLNSIVSYQSFYRSTDYAPIKMIDERYSWTCYFLNVVHCFRFNFHLESGSLDSDRNIVHFHRCKVSSIWPEASTFFNLYIMPCLTSGTKSTGTDKVFLFLVWIRRPGPVSDTSSKYKINIVSCYLVTRQIITGFWI